MTRKSLQLAKDFIIAKYLILLFCLFWYTTRRRGQLISQLIPCVIHHRGYPRGYPSGK